MLILYDLNHNKIEGLINYKDLKLEMEINIDDTLSFSYTNADVKNDLIQEECYIRTIDNEYVVKEVNLSDDNWTEYICKLNVESIKGQDVARFETIEESCTTAVNFALAQTNWTIGSCNVTKLRTVRKNNCTAYEVLEEIQTVYTCEMTFDALNKKVYIYKGMGQDKGTYFAEQLNLKQLETQRHSYDYITRLIPLGKDGLTIASVNSGLNFIVNYQYSNKIITAFWEDNRYTVVQSLKDDAIERLAYLSKPYKSYKAEIIDLARINPQYAVLDYNLGDNITLLSASKKTKEKQRIIKITRYPNEPERNTCEIANKLLKLEDLQVRLATNSDVLETVTTSDGFLDGTKIEGFDWSDTKIYVQDDEPDGAEGPSVWIDTNDYSRYDSLTKSADYTLLVSDNEVIKCTGTFSLTLHVGTSAGIIKKIYNIGEGIIMLLGMINGITNMWLYPGESIELITDGTNWRH